MQLYLPGCDPWNPADFPDEAVEPEGAARVDTLESGDARTSTTTVDGPEEPPQAFLASLWEGRYGQGTVGT